MSNDFFETFNPETVNSLNFDEKIIQETNDRELKCIFFWGHDCPNCEIAKRAFIERKKEVSDLNIKLYHANIYEDFELATRFGLFGIPVFMFFRNGKKLGKISPYPGWEPFSEAVLKL